MTITQATREQTRARYPDEQGFVERDGATRAASLIAELL